ncbi:hypothetical protein JVU11DRAFT_8037 [Chiua virens]|nr:hypothetical protein JVU11DRAFT_8037 [Chiua virens]
MFEESAPPSPNQALVALAPLAPEWQPILHASHQVVLYNPTSHALSIHKSPTVHVPDRPNSPCPFCHRPLPPGFAHENEDEDLRHEGSSHSRAANYFHLLAIANESSRPSSPPPLGNGNRPSAFPREAMAEGYFKMFFQEEYRLGMGANGSVYLCQHVLDGNPLGHFAVKKIAVGESHSYLLGILREVRGISKASSVESHGLQIRLLETLRHRNIITYHHAWLETCQFSAFGPKVPTLQLIGIGSLDDLIDLRQGRPTKLPHMWSSRTTDSPTEAQSPLARIRAFRAMKRAPPEERERLRREMAERSNGRGRSSLKAVHLFGAEEVKSLFSDVVEGLAFLHDRSILHLDLKPGNVLLTWDESKLMQVLQLPRAMLSDFGTSRDMIHSSGSRSGNTGTLEYASPESLPSPQTGRLQEVDSKSDMWSLGMILHKMLFFRLPYHYATEGEISDKDEVDKMNKLEQEISRYPGFRTTSTLLAVFEGRHLPRAFLILLEGLLSVNPPVRPTCERILSAMREGRFNPVVSTPRSSSGSLIPVRRSMDGVRTASMSPSPRALPPPIEQDYSSDLPNERGRQKSASPSSFAITARGQYKQSTTLGHRTCAGDTSVAGDTRKEPSLPLTPTSFLSTSKSTFWHQLRSLLRIVIPSIRSREALLLIAHSSFLVLRTVLSVAVAKLDGRIVRDLVSADSLWLPQGSRSLVCPGCAQHLHKLYDSLPPVKALAPLSGSSHSVYSRPLPLVRTSPSLLPRPSSGPRPVYHSRRRVMVGKSCWHLVRPSSPAVLAQADPCTHSGNLMKPSLDLLLFTSQLSRSLGFRGTFLLFVNYYMTIKILQAVTPAFGRLSAIEARLEGDYRAGVGRVGRESEEVAFYNGGPLERDLLTRAYLRLIKHVNSIYKIRIAYEWTEDFVIKYLWSAVGYGLIAVPLLFTRKHGEGKDQRARDGVVAERTETYISNRRLLLSLADAGGRLMYAYKDLVEVAGLTGRLYTLLSTLHNLAALPPADAGDGNTFELRDVDVCIPSLAHPSPMSNGEAKEKSVSPTFDEDAEPLDHLPGSGTTLVRALSLALHPGMHLMITGSNGVGKTAVARVLTGLWAPSGSGARVTRPTSNNDTMNGRPRPGVFIIPQRAYMVTGSLLEQVIYPQVVGEFYALHDGNAEEGLKELQSILEAAHIGYLVEREGGWGTVKEWRDVLSGGEKQRMALSRVFYHRPKFAILDECTSAVSSDVEGRMYEHAKLLGISLITISLRYVGRRSVCPRSRMSCRPALAKYHTHLLTLVGDGTGRWTFAAPDADAGTDTASPDIRIQALPLDPTRSTTLDAGSAAGDLVRVLEEIRTLEKQLEDSKVWEARVRELNDALEVREGDGMSRGG